MHLLRDRGEDLAAAGIRPFAISRDSPWSHRAWAQSLGVDVPLLSDWNGDATRAFDVAFEPLGMTDVPMRSAFLIRDGETIEAAWMLGGDLPDIDDLRPCAVRLATPGVGDNGERHALDVEPDVARDRVLDEPPVVDRELVGRNREARVPEDRQALEAHGRGRELRHRARRLAEVDDRRPGNGGLNRGGRRLAPQRVEDVVRTFAAEGVLEGGDQVVRPVEADRRIGSDLRGALEARGASSRGDDSCGAEQLRDLHRDKSDRAGRAEDEHLLAALQGRTPGERQPPGEAGDPEPSGKRRIGAVRHVVELRVSDRCPFGHRTVRRPSE